METNNSKDDVVNDSTNSKDSEEDESFVTKVRSRVSGLFSSSISRLFNNQEKRSGIVRLRPSEDEEINQPPRKRARGLENDVLSSEFHRETTVPELSNNSMNEPGLGNNFEPIAGPSYISQRSSQNIISTPLVSTESTNIEKYVDSGYSSMAKVCDKPSEVITSNISISSSKPTENTFGERKSLFNTTTPETPNRSLFSDHVVSPQDKNTSLTSRRPSFTSTSFGSQSFADRTFTSGKIISSPFYNGSTIYGGASAYGRQLGINETRQQQLKNSFLVKPINKSSESKSFTSLSKTARRILQTLEECSTPLSDVTKIPLPSRSDKQGLFSKYVAVNPYLKNSKFSNKELLVPSVSDRLKMKQMQRLQDKTNEIRQIATSSSLNTGEYKIASDNQQKHTNKMKSKISSVRPKAATIDIIDNFILNPVPLMIPENKLPKFNVSELKVPVVTPSASKEKSVVEMKKPNRIKNVLNVEEEKSNSEKERPAIEKQIKSVIQESNTNEPKTVIKDSESGNNDNVVEYIFSKPLIIADNSKSIIAINNFKFSEPLSKKIKFTGNICEPTQKKMTNETKMTNGNISGDSDTGNLKLSNPLMEKFKAPEGTWECQTCLIRNKSGVTKCAACEAPRVESKNSKKDSTFGLQFSRKLDEWDCSVCLVRNKVENVVCVACSTPKISKPEINGIGNKFKMQSSEWECKTCWVRNKNESLKCAACETARRELDDVKTPSSKKCLQCFNEIKGSDGQCLLCESSKTKSSFPSHLKPSSDTWECGTCLIRNKNELKTCAACETPREKNTNEIKTETLSKKSDKWECPTCMVRNNSDVEKCPCCETAKPGITLVNKSNVSMFNFGVNKTQFSFGIPKDMQSVNPPSSSLFSNNSTETSGSAPVFKFGISPENKEKDQGKTEPKISFPPLASAEPKSQSVVVENDKPPSSNFQFKTPAAVPNKNSVPVFKFGTESKEPAKDASVPKPSFKFDPSKQKTVENSFKIGNDLTSPAQGPKIPENTSVAAPPVPKSDPATALFSFGNKENSKDQTGKPMFSFGTSSSSSTQGFNFNPVKSDMKQKPAAATGFTTSSVPQSQSTNSGSTPLKNGGFNFGSTSTSNNQAAVFSFGAAPNPAETTQLSKSGFDFSAAVKPTGGFNFSSPAPAFEAGAKPTFNFTGGSVPTFSANPTEGAGGPVPVRKFKRAVRRTQR